MNITNATELSEIKKEFEEFENGLFNKYKFIITDNIFDGLFTDTEREEIKKEVIDTKNAATYFLMAHHTKPTKHEKKMMNMMLENAHVEGFYGDIIKNKKRIKRGLTDEFIIVLDAIKENVLNRLIEKYRSLKDLFCYKIHLKTRYSVFINENTNIEHLNRIHMFLKGMVNIKILSFIFWCSGLGYVKNTIEDDDAESLYHHSSIHIFLHMIFKEWYSRFKINLKCLDVTFSIFHPSEFGINILSKIITTESVFNISPYSLFLNCFKENNI